MVAEEKDSHGSTNFVGACPRCGTKWDMRDHANAVGMYPALSRRDNKTYICSACGNVEAFEDSGLEDWNPQQKIYWEMPTLCSICGKLLNGNIVQMGYRSGWAHKKCMKKEEE